MEATATPLATTTASNTKGDTAMKIRTCTAHTLSVVEQGHLNKWMDYVIEKQKKVYDDNGETKTYYELYIDGDSDGEFKTLKDARQYIKDLRESWLENHPGEKLF